MTDSVVSSGSSVISGTRCKFKKYSEFNQGPSFIQNDTASSNIFTPLELIHSNR